MATTPEGRVKDAVKKALATHGVYPFVEVAQGKHTVIEGTYYMPVAGPFSVHGVHDFVGCWSGKFFSIETKAPNEPVDETVHQGRFREAITLAKGIALTGVRDGPAAVDHIRNLITQGESHGSVNQA
jgi:hypothetical protein